MYLIKSDSADWKLMYLIKSDSADCKLMADWCMFRIVCCWFWWQCLWGIGFAGRPISFSTRGSEPPRHNQHYYESWCISLNPTLQIESWCISSNPTLPIVSWWLIGACFELFVAGFDGNVSEVLVLLAGLSLSQRGVRNHHATINITSNIEHRYYQKQYKPFVSLLPCLIDCCILHFVSRSLGTTTPQSTWHRTPNTNTIKNSTNLSFLSCLVRLIVASCILSLAVLLIDERLQSASC